MRKLERVVSTLRRSLTPQITIALLLAGLAQGAAAQSFCSSDGQPRPVQLMERFLNADCDSCWRDPATPAAPGGHAVLDWVIPGSKGDDAPLSAVASRDGLTRLNALGKTVPSASMTSTLPVRALRGAKLRVAHGIALSGYIGASIELKPAPVALQGQRWTVWLALVETIPVGAEGSPVERNLVRNLLQPNWNVGQKLSKEEQNRFFDSRSMSVAPGVNADRLRVIGWVEDDNGRIIQAAQSRCAVEPG